MSDWSNLAKIAELHSLLRDWPSPPKDEADRQSLRTRKTRVLLLIEDEEVKESIAEGADTDEDVRTHAQKAQFSLRRRSAGPREAFRPHAPFADAPLPFSPCLLRSVMRCFRSAT
jgi:hypothetical protein